MVTHDTLTLRRLRPTDVTPARRILDTSEYVHLRFSPEELTRLVQLYPGMGAFSGAQGPLGRVIGGSLQAFAQINELTPPSAWIGGFGVTWSQSEHFRDYLALLLPALQDAVWERDARHLYYSGSDFENDWLREPLETLGFSLTSMLRSYDKTDMSVPSEGNQRIVVRPFRASDAAPLAELEKLCFDDLWRHDARAFAEVAKVYPYFVVAEDEQGVVGYQFNVVDMKIGYLVRIATHPRVWGAGVGTRLMAEAIHYFQRANVWKIVLNTEETNTRAHRLYEWFNFYLIRPRGFALGLTLTPPQPSRL
jgi:ribosomal protein S18 acetylase RimI-like enzyme